jgi:apolipoprotein N-acyltransferase
MNLVQRYIKTLNKAHKFWAEILIIFPACISSVFWIQEAEHNIKLIITAIVCTIITCFHIGIGLHCLLNKQYWSFFNFMCLPIIIIISAVAYL